MKWFYFNPLRSTGQQQHSHIQFPLQRYDDTLITTVSLYPESLRCLETTKTHWEKWTWIGQNHCGEFGRVSKCMDKAAEMRRSNCIGSVACVASDVTECSTTTANSLEPTDIAQKQTFKPTKHMLIIQSHLHQSYFNPIVPTFYLNSPDSMIYLHKGQFAKPINQLTCISSQKLVKLEESLHISELYAQADMEQR